MTVKRLIGAAVAGIAFSACVVGPATAEEMGTMDFVVRDDHVQMIVFGSGYHVDEVTITSTSSLQGPSNYRFYYYANTSADKSKTKICGGGSTGNDCHHQFNNINATYGTGSRICGSITRMSDYQDMGTACKNF